MRDCDCDACDTCLRIDYWIDKADEARIEELRMGDG